MSCTASNVVMNELLFKCSVEAFYAVANLWTAWITEQMSYPFLIHVVFKLSWKLTSVIRLYRPYWQGVDCLQLFKKVQSAAAA